MWFGKRGATAAAQTAGRQASQQDMRQRILPAELWEGELGDLLRAIGKSPDDESNLVTTGDSIDARIARDRAAHEARLDEINRDVARRTGGGRVKAYFLLSDPCWNSEAGTFLMARLQFYPYDAWNVLFLPEDERTAKIMNLPVHPGSAIPGSVELVESWHREAKAKMDAAHAEAGRTYDFGALEATKQGIQADVWGLASYLANHIGAAAAWKPQG
jgi:hypothetical protein